jgi:uncharacterized protein YlxP (DUF503 family)
MARSGCPLTARVIAPLRTVIKVTAARIGSCDISDIADLGILAAAARQKG